MNILRITIVTRKHGSDIIFLDTDLPAAGWSPHESQDLKFCAAKGTGKSYVEKHFPGVPMSVVEG